MENKLHQGKKDNYHQVFSTHVEPTQLRRLLNDIPDSFYIETIVTKNSIALTPCCFMIYGYR